MSPRPETILTPERVSAALTRALPECAGRFQIIDCRLADLTLAPGVRSAAHFRVRFRDRGDGAEFTEGFTVRLPVEGGEAIALPPDMAARYATLPNRRFALPEVALPDLGGLAHPHPLDVGLPGLIGALDTRAMKDHFARLLKPRGVQVMHLKARQISYTLGARATLRYDLRLRDATGAQTTDTVIGKLNSRKEVATLMADNLALWRRTADTFGQAAPLGVIQAMGLSLQSFVPGTRLTDHMQDDAIADHLAATGTALARFHAARIPQAKTRDAAREVRSLERRCALLRNVHPEPSRIETLQQRISAALRQRLRLTGPTHGDFHHANVMVAADGTVSLIDFDEMGLGDQALDVGRFIVSLSVPSLRVRGDLSLCDLARDSFLAAYRAERAVSDADLGMYEAAGWVTSAVTAYRLQRDGWQSVMDAMIARAEAAVARSETADAAPPATPAAALSQTEITEWLQDTDIVSLHLKPHVHAAHGAELTALALRHVRPVDHAVKITYKATGIGPDGKWRSHYTALAAPGANPRRIKRAVLAVRDGLDGAPLQFPAISARVQPLGALFFRTPDGDSLSALPPDALTALAPRLARGFAALSAVPGDAVRQRRPEDLVTCDAPDLLETVLAAAPNPAPGLEQITLSGLVDQDGVILCTRPDRLVWGPAPLLLAGFAHALQAIAPKAAQVFGAEVRALSRIEAPVWDAALRLVDPQTKATR